MRDNKEDCPNCGVDLQGDPIPEDRQHLYNATHFGRKIGSLKGDRSAEMKWECPDCHATWPA